MDTQIFSKIGKLLVKSKNILILLPAEPSVDAAAAGLAFYLSLKATGKQATIACSEKIPVNLNRLIGIDKIQNQTGGQNLVVAFEYLEDSIEKVSYNINDGKFNLVIQPKEGYPPLDSQKLSYNYTGSTADVVVVIGCQRPETIGRIYTEEKKAFTEAETINIDINHFNSRFGKTNFVDPQGSSCSELIGLIIKNLNMTVNPDVATNILAGMEANTNNFSIKTRGETFELTGWAMQQGGRRQQMQPASSAGRQPFDARPFMYPSAGGSGGPAGKPSPIMRPTYQPAMPPVQPAYNNLPAYQPPAYEPAVPSPAIPFSFGNEPLSAPKRNAPVEPAPPEWLKPKIYKGSSQM